jgi:hypothetical protein
VPYVVFITTPRAGLGFAVAPYTVEAKTTYNSKVQAQAFADARVLSPEIKALFDAMPSYFPAWQVSGATYAVGQYVAHVGKTWRCAVAHTTAGDANWAPGGTANLWTLEPNPGAGAWVSGAAYPLPSTVTYGGRAYSLVQAHTSQDAWTPPAVPALWSDIGPASVVEPYNRAIWTVVDVAEPDFTQVNRVKEPGTR